MNSSQSSQATPPGSGGDGPGRGLALLYKALAVLLVAGVLAYLYQWVRSESATSKTAGSDTSSDGSGAAPGTAGNGRAALASGTTAAANATSAHRDPNDLAHYVAPGQPAPTMNEVIARLHDAGVHEGLGAFQPPGTSPPLVGLAVPEDFPLPAGYVRHYQATDDGQRIEPILMFSPDYEFFDRAGRPIAIPDNRVVPPELAPPGLPIRNIVIPPPVDPRNSPP